MKYMLLFYEAPEQFARRNAEDAERYWNAWQACGQAMHAAGIVVDGNCLMPPGTATTVRMRPGRNEVQDGPFADSREQLGGAMVIDVEDLDAALQWASRVPCASTGAVEVRPIADVCCETAEAARSAAAAAASR